MIYIYLFAKITTTHSEGCAMTNIATDQNCNTCENYQQPGQIARIWYKNPIAIMIIIISSIATCVTIGINVTSNKTKIDDHLSLPRFSKSDHLPYEVELERSRLKIEALDQSLNAALQQIARLDERLSKLAK
jgi:hypothetical protein